MAKQLLMAFLLLGVTAAHAWQPQPKPPMHVRSYWVVRGPFPFLWWHRKETTYSDGVRVFDRVGPFGGRTYQQSPPVK